MLAIKKERDSGARTRRHCIHFTLPNYEAIVKSLKLEKWRFSAWVVMRLLIDFFLQRRRIWSLTSATQHPQKMFAFLYLAHLLDYRQILFTSSKLILHIEYFIQLIIDICIKWNQCSCTQYFPKYNDPSRLWIKNYKLGKCKGFVCCIIINQ